MVKLDFALYLFCQQFLLAVGPKYMLWPNSAQVLGIKKSIVGLMFKKISLDSQKYIRKLLMLKIL